MSSFFRPIFLSNGCRWQYDGKEEKNECALGKGSGVGRGEVTIRYEDVRFVRILICSLCQAHECDSCDQISDRFGVFTVTTGLLIGNHGGILYGSQSSRDITRA